jgi:hypothetical protein
MSISLSSAWLPLGGSYPYHLDSYEDCQLNFAIVSGVRLTGCDRWVSNTNYRGKAAGLKLAHCETKKEADERSGCGEV